MSKKIVLLIIVLVGLSAGFAIYQYEHPSLIKVITGDYTILLLAADPSETISGTSEERPGMGAVDMAFAVGFRGGSVSNLTPIYPSGMTHPTVMEPTEANAGGGHLYLHDSLWNSDTAQGAEYAEEIVEYNTGIKSDVVIIVTPEAADAIINSVSPINVTGYSNGTNAAIEFIRNLTEEKNSTLSRGDASERIMKPVLTAVKNPNKLPGLLETVINQSIKGNLAIILL